MALLFLCLLAGEGILKEVLSETRCVGVFQDAVFVIVNFQLSTKSVI